MVIPQAIVAETEGRFGCAPPRRRIPCPAMFDELAPGDELEIVLEDGTTIESLIYAGRVDGLITFENHAAVPESIVASVLVSIPPLGGFE